MSTTGAAGTTATGRTSSSVAKPPSMRSTGSSAASAKPSAAAPATVAAPRPAPAPAAPTAAASPARGAAPAPTADAAGASTPGGTQERRRSSAAGASAEALGQIAAARAEAEEQRRAAERLGRELATKDAEARALRAALDQEAARGAATKDKLKALVAEQQDQLQHADRSLATSLLRAALARRAHGSLCWAVRVWTAAKGALDASRALDEAARSAVYELPVLPSAHDEGAAGALCVHVGAGSALQLVEVVLGPARLLVRARDVHAHPAHPAARAGSRGEGGGVGAPSAWGVAFEPALYMGQRSGSAVRPSVHTLHGAGPPGAERRYELIAVAADAHSAAHGAAHGAQHAAHKRGGGAARGGGGGGGGGAGGVLRVRLRLAHGVGAASLHAASAAAGADVGANGAVPLAPPPPGQGKGRPPPPPAPAAGGGAPSAPARPEARPAGARPTALGDGGAAAPQQQQRPQQQQAAHAAPGVRTFAYSGANGGFIAGPTAHTAGGGARAAPPPGAAGALGASPARGGGGPHAPAMGGGAASHAPPGRARTPSAPDPSLAAAFLTYESSSTVRGRIGVRALRGALHAAGVALHGAGARQILLQEEAGLGSGGGLAYAAFERIATRMRAAHAAALGGGA